MNEEEIAELLNHKDSKKNEISFIFKFRIFQLNFAAKIIVLSTLQFVTELKKVNFVFLKALEIF